MHTTKYVLSNLLHDQCGQDFVEYALVAARVALAAIASLKQVGSAANAVFTTVGNRLNSAV